MEMSIPCSVCTEIPSIVTVRTFFIGKPSFDGFGKFSPKTKKRVLLSVPREQRVNALCMEKSDLHKLSCIYMDLQKSGYQY